MTARRLKITWSGCVNGGSWVVFNADRHGGDGWPIMPSQALYSAPTFDECLAWIDAQ